MCVCKCGLDLSLYCSLEWLRSDFCSRLSFIIIKTKPNRCSFFSHLFLLQLSFRINAHVAIEFSSLSSFLLSPAQQTKKFGAFFISISFASLFFVVVSRCYYDSHTDIRCNQIHSLSHTHKQHKMNTAALNSEKTILISEVKIIIRILLHSPNLILLQHFHNHFFALFPLGCGAYCIQRIVCCVSLFDNDVGWVCELALAYHLRISISSLEMHGATKAA